MTDTLTDYYFLLLLREAHEQISVDESSNNATQEIEAESESPAANAMEYENRLPTTSNRWSPYVVSLINVFIFVIVGFILSEMIEIGRAHV